MPNPTMFYRAPQDGDDLFETTEGAVAYCVVDLDESAPPAGWFATYPEALANAPKKRGRPRKEDVSDDGDSN